MRALRWGIQGLAVVAGAVIVIGAGAVLCLRASLPMLDGEVAAAGLSAPVTVVRDSAGVPTVTAANRADAAYALGVVHAQDRFFQMDLSRRLAAGELAELFGAVAVGMDRVHRPHRFRARAIAALAVMPAADRAVLDRYVAGVNDGLARLTVRPFEYGVLATAPRPWRAEDSLLVGRAMYFNLQGEFQRKLAREWIRIHATPEQLAFLLPDATAYDAPLDAPSIDGGTAPIPAVAPDWVIAAAALPDQGGQTLALEGAGAADAIVVGSNNWAVAGTRTESGAAIISNDMHLGLQLPNTWYRAVMIFADGQGRPWRLAGVTLPGMPALVAGSNGHVAWGFTNSYGDYLDLVELVHDQADPSRFHLADGRLSAIRTTSERIAVKGGPDIILPVGETELGPVWRVGDKDYAMHWMAHDPGAISLSLMAMETAPTLQAFLAAANRAAIPAQNVVAGDADGHIGWTIAGPLPDRMWNARDGFPYLSTEAGRGFIGRRDPDRTPRVVDPPGGQLWTANARQLAGPDYALIGDGGPDLGARASQIRNDLAALGKARESDVYGIGLDDRALFMESWRHRALAVLTDQAVDGHPQRAEFRRLLRDGWDGRASVDSVGYRLAEGYLMALYHEVFGGLDATLTAYIGQRTAFMRGATGRWAQVLGRLEDERPAGWLPRGKADWQALDLAAVDRVIADLAATGQPMATASWGQANRVRIGHPFAKVFPFLAPLLSAPEDRQSGDSNMPKVAAPSFGQSERMTVAPGHEEQGLFTMPGGQSGHPASPFFLAGQADWVAGRPDAFLPGPEAHRLTLRPETGGATAQDAR